MASKSLNLAKLVRDLNTDGNITASGLAEGAGGGLDSNAVTNLIDSSYISAREANADAGGVTSYDSEGLFPSDASVGDFALDSSNNTLFLYGNAGSWKPIYLGENLLPEWSTEPPDTLEVNGGDSATLTAVATDPDGFPITYSYDLSNSLHPGLDSVINNNDGTFTLRANTDSTGEFNFRTKASDGLQVLSKLTAITVSQPTYGEIYAGFYLALTSGNQTDIAGNDSTYVLDDDIDAATNGDALVLAPGTYKINCTSPGSETMYSHPWRDKEIAILGNGDSSNAVVLTVDHTSARDKPIFGGGSTGKCHMANMRLIRNDISSTSYVSAIVRGTSGGDGAGYMRHVIFDNNDNGGNNADISWVYDNGNASVNRVRINNCSFVNYNSWDSKYTGDVDHVEVNNCAFEGTYDTNDVTYGSGDDANQASVTFDASYGYTGESSYGHRSDRDITSSDISIDTTF